MSNQTKLKRVVIKEELVALTGDYIKALILNQFLYWSERTKDVDQYIREEKQRDPNAPSMGLTHGWIYKTAEDLSNELMLGVSDSTIRRHLSVLIEGGWIDQRNNPNHKWDRTLQYRPNIRKIQVDLQELGYSLEGYPILNVMKDAFFKMKNGVSKTENRTAENEGALPETTTKTTTKILPASQNFSSEGNREEDQDHKAALNELASYVADNICNIAIGMVSEKTRDQLKKITLALYRQDVTKADLDRFGEWWYACHWKGKKLQPPAPTDIGDSWGEFESWQVKGNEVRVVNSDGSLNI